MSKKFLLLSLGFLFGLLFGLMIFRNYLPFDCGENFARIYAINKLHVSKLIDEGYYEHAVEFLEKLENTYHEKKECDKPEILSILLGAGIHMTGGGFDAINDPFRLQEIDRLKKLAADRKETEMQKIKKKGSLN